MDETNEKKKNLFIQLNAEIYVSIKEKSLNASQLFFFSSIFELTNKILIIDIIFNYKRTFKNIYFFLYFITPSFYFEVLNNSKLFIKEEAKKIDNYYKDQINLIMNEYFNIDIHEQKDYFDFKMFGLMYLIFLLLLLLFNLIRVENCIINTIKQIASYLFYITFCTISHIFLLIFNRNIFIQFTNSYYEIDYNFLFDVFLFLLYNILYYLFYKIFIYAYGQNETYYFLSSNIFIATFFLNEIGTFLYIIRHHIKFSILFQLIWSIIYIYEYSVRIQVFRDSLHQSFSKKISFCLQTFVFAIFVVRFITLFFINYLEHEQIFKILEGILIILVVVVLFFNLNNPSKSISFSKLKDDLIKEDNEFFKGTNQLFIPLFKFFSSKTKTKKLKFKENFFQKYKEDLKNHFCNCKDDYMILCNGNEKLIEKFSNSDTSKNRESGNAINLNDEKKNSIILLVLLQLINNFYKIAKEKSYLFGKLAMETLIYNKILLFAIIDEKTFRAQYYLKKFIYSEKFKNADLLIYSIFLYLSFHFIKLEKKNDENSMEFTIYFNYMNYHYLQIIKSFKLILKSFSKSQKEILRIIDKQSINIGKSLDTILDMIYNSYDSVKIKDQSENEKFKLVEDILFNANFEKSIEFFDLNTLDSIVEKNNYFLILFQNGKFIIKKAPLTYYKLTGIKSSKMLNVPSINIYPYIMRKSQEKYIKNTILTKKFLKEECVLETSENYIINAKLTYTTLPTFKGQLFIMCTLEQIPFPDDSNYILMQSNGICYEYGLFFKNYFGFNNQLKRLNFLNVLGIVDYNPSINNIQTFNVNLNEFISNLKTHLIRDSGIQNSEIIQIIKTIRENFKSLKEIKVCFNFKKRIQIKGDEIYLLQIIFEDLKIKILNDKKEIENNDLDYVLTPNNASINASHSGTTILSYKIIKEKAWNITSKKKEKIKISKNTIDIISFIYNLFLVIIAILICILIKLFSNQFYKEYIKILILREMNLSYLSNVFYLINMICLNGSDSLYDSLNYEYKKLIKDYNISLIDYYQYNFQLRALKLLEISNYFKNNYSSLNTHSQLYKQFNEYSFKVLRPNGEFDEVTYYHCFDIPKNYFYILSQQDNYKISIPFLDLNNIHLILNGLNEFQQYIICTINNSFLFIKMVKYILKTSKKVFRNSLNNYKIIMLFIFIIFLCLNIFSIFLLYLSIEMTNKKMYLITKKIMKITLKGKNYLEKKLKYVKRIIQNELKPSIAIEQLKEINPITKQKQMNNAQFTMSHDIKEINEDDKEDMFLIQFNINQKNKNHHFISYIKSFKTILLLGSIYLIFIIITFPIMISYFDKLVIKKKETESIQDLQELILSYYIGVRLSIILNSTDLQLELGIFGAITDYLFGNYTEANRLMITENEKSIIEYLNIVNNESNTCNYLLKENQYKYSLNLICDLEPLMKTNIETMISGFINQLRSEFLNFNRSEKNENNLIYYFHSRTFQFNNLQVIIFFMNYFSDLEYDYTIPDLQRIINNLMVFLIIMFIIMVITEIIYYFSSNIFVLGRMSSSFNDYVIIEKFFSYDDISSNKK